MTMKLSEAIREGAKNTLPLNNGNLVERDNEGNLHACALGAAFLAMGGDENTQAKDIYTALGQRWPELVTVEVEGAAVLEDVIWRKNDRLGWERERTAEFVESLGY